jgi:hypothetical protein
MIYWACWGGNHLYNPLKIGTTDQQKNQCLAILTLQHPASLKNAARRVITIIYITHWWTCEYVQLLAGVFFPLCLVPVFAIIIEKACTKQTPYHQYIHRKIYFSICIKKLHWKQETNFFSIFLNTSTGEYIILFSILPNIIECIKQTPIKTSKYRYYQMTLRFDTSSSIILIIG